MSTSIGKVLLLLYLLSSDHFEPQLDQTLSSSYIPGIVWTQLGDTTSHLRLTIFWSWAKVKPLVLRGESDNVKDGCYSVYISVRQLGSKLPGAYEF